MRFGITMWIVVIQRLVEEALHQVQVRKIMHHVAIPTQEVLLLVEDAMERLILLLVVRIVHRGIDVQVVKVFLVQAERTG